VLFDNQSSRRMSNCHLIPVDTDPRLWKDSNIRFCSRSRQP
jgi:hypothetical protein